MAHPLRRVSLSFRAGRCQVVGSNLVSENEPNGPYVAHRGQHILDAENRLLLGRVGDGGEFPSITVAASWKQGGTPAGDGRSFQVPEPQEAPMAKPDPHTRRR